MSTHVRDDGSVHMVDVGTKPSTERMARTRVELALGREAHAQLQDNSLPKGDLLATVRIAGIQAAKRCSDLIPLCHPLPLTKVEIDIRLEEPGMVIECEARTTGPTGVEMEAMTGASVAALTAYDMLKGIERGIQIGPLRLLEKSGGRSGHWKAS